MTKWRNYKQAKNLPPEVVERMWRTLDRIAEACQWEHPADPEFMTKKEIGAAATRALPGDGGGHQ
jgi:diadenosine tetraphosphate (Ap4A) HIT family hydrolase